MRRWEWACGLIAEGEGCRLIVSGMAEPAGLFGFVGKHAGVFDAEFGKAAAAIARIIRESDGSAPSRAGVLMTWWSPPPANDSSALGAELRATLLRMPGAEPHRLPAACADRCLRSIRPMALAKLWTVPPDHAVEMFLAAARKGIVAMGRPVCRAAAARSPA